MTQTCQNNNSETLPKEPTPKSQRLRIIKEEGEAIGLWNIKRTEMGKRFNVSPRTIYSDIQSIYKKGIDKDSVDKAVVNIDNLNKQLLTGLQKSFNNAKTARDKAIVAHALLATQEKMTDFLEKYGFKDKVADKTELMGQPINITINDSRDKYPKLDVPASKQ